MKNILLVLCLTCVSTFCFTQETIKPTDEFKITGLCSDGYTVVYSWNEIFNTEIGKSIYVITEADNKKLSESNERILVICTMDFKTGRRHLKGLESIEIKRI